MKFALLLLPIFFSGCAFVESQRGALIHSAANVPDPKEGAWYYPREFGNSKSVVFGRAFPMTVVLSHPAKEDVLLVGPDFFIPLPVIPWPPGLIHRLSAKSRDESSDPVEVVLNFSRPWGYFRDNPEPMDIQLDTRDFALVSGSATIVASSVTYEVHQTRRLDPPRQVGNTLQYWEQISDPFADRCGLKDGVLRIHVSSEYDRGTTVHVRFPLTYKDLTTSVLRLGRASTSKGDYEIPPSVIENRRRLRFERNAINT